MQVSPPNLGAFPLDETVTLDDQGRLQTEVRCQRCGYNLRTQLLDAACPECGRSVGESVVSFKLRAQNKIERTKALKSLAKSGLRITIAVLVVYLLLSIRQVRGTEISPDTLRVRNYTFWTFVPFGTNFSLTSPSYGSSRGSPLQEHLVERGLVKNSENGRWWLCSSARPFNRLSKGPMFNLSYGGRFTNGESTQWVEWSNAHPQLADELWPAVVEFVRHDPLVGVGFATQLLHGNENQNSMTLEELQEEISRMRKVLATVPSEDEQR